MKIAGITTPIFTSSNRRSVLTAGVLSALIFTGCSGSESSVISDTPATATAEQQSGETTDQQSASAEETANQPVPSENFAGAEQLAQAETVSVETSEVQTAEELYIGVQNALSGVEPVEAPDSTEETEVDSDNAESQETLESDKYVSEVTVAQLEEVSTGSALDQYLATATEYAMSGWQLEGNSEVVGAPRIADGEYNGHPAKVLEVCLDSSDIKVTNTVGAQVNPTQLPRSLNIFTLIEDNGEWKIASHDFPNEADC